MGQIEAAAGDLVALSGITLHLAPSQTVINAQMQTKRASIRRAFRLYMCKPVIQFTGL
jgi:hypothetical protein